MSTRLWIGFAVCIALGCSEASEAPEGSPAPVPQGAAAELTLAAGMRGATRVVVASVEDVHADFAVNEFGDRLIISTVTLRVRETLRGDASPTLKFALEGGSVGNLSLDVSDMPKLNVGDRGVFALRRSVSGDTWVPNARSLGIALLDIDRELDAARRAEGASR